MRSALALGMGTPVARRDHGGRADGARCAGGRGPGRHRVPARPTAAAGGGRRDAARPASDAGRRRERRRGAERAGREARPRPRRHRPGPGGGRRAAGARAGGRPAGRPGPGRRAAGQGAGRGRGPGGPAGRGRAAREGLVGQPRPAEQDDHLPGPDHRSGDQRPADPAGAAFGRRADPVHAGPVRARTTGCRSPADTANLSAADRAQPADQPEPGRRRQDGEAGRRADAVRCRLDLHRTRPARPAWRHRHLGRPELRGAAAGRARAAVHRGVRRRAVRGHRLHGERPRHGARPTRPTGPG